MRDTAMMLDCLGKPMPGDPFVIARPDRPWAEFLARSKRRFRIGWSARPLMDAPVDPEIAAAVERVAQVLAGLGCAVEEAQPKIDLAAMDEGCRNLWYFQFDRYLDRLASLAGRTVGPDTVEKATLKFYEFAKRQTADAFFRSMANFNRMRRDMGQFFQTYDLWLSPTCAQVAQPNGVHGMNIDIGPEEFLIHEQRPCQFMVPYNVRSQPALSLPLAMHSNGLPIGVQFGARHSEEQRADRARRPSGTGAAVVRPPAAPGWPPGLTALPAPVQLAAMDDGNPPELYGDDLVDMLERIWGDGWLSPGGPEELGAFSRVSISPANAVLDIGCGAGGIDMLLARSMALSTSPASMSRTRCWPRPASGSPGPGLGDRIGLAKVVPGPLPFPPVDFRYRVQQGVRSSISPTSTP